MRGRFVSGLDASRRRLTGTAGLRRFDAFAGGYDALGSPTGGVGPASNRGGSAGGKKSGGSSSAKRAKTQVDEAAKAADEQIGSASCRERVWQYGEISVVGVTLKQQQHKNAY